MFACLCDRYHRVFLFLSFATNYKLAHFLHSFPVMGSVLEKVFLVTFYRRPSRGCVKYKLNVKLNK